MNKSSEYPAVKPQTDVTDLELFKNKPAELDVQETYEPAALVELAIRQNVDLDKMKWLMEMKERYEAKQAKAKFTEALSAFQSECPRIPKRREVTKRDGGKLYNFNAYEDTMAIISPYLVKHGIGLSFSFPPTEGNFMRCVLTISVGSHSEDRELTVPIPAGNNVNKTQEYGMAVTYVKRYVLEAGLGIVVTGQDTDGHGLGETIDENQQLTMDSLIQSIENNGGTVNMQNFWKAAGVTKDNPTFGDIPIAKYDKIMAGLREKLAGLKK